MNQPNANPPVLVVAALRVVYPDGTRAVDDADLEIHPGECLALVGDSGSGKTTIARAVLGLLPRGTRVTGSIRLAGTEIVGAADAALRQLRGRTVGFVAQNPFAATNPLHRVGTHVAEAWRAHRRRPPAGAVTERLGALGIPQPAGAARQWPHQWSGGMLQRATIAAASAHHPPLLVADEPTSALDAERADAVLGALRQAGAAVLLISHDQRLVARHAGRVVHCHAGRVTPTPVATTGPSRPSGLRKLPALRPAPILAAAGLSKTYGDRHRSVAALLDATLEVAPGEIVGIKGPSGSGKSTLLRLLATLESLAGGTLHLDGQPHGGPGWHRPAPPGFVMTISQNPYASLDARWPLWRTITEPLTAPHRPDRPTRAVRRALAREWLDRIGLQTIDERSRPATLSGGECQRVAILRALAAQPRLLLADEPTSALDASATGSVLRLLADATHNGAAVVVVSHDEATLASICHRIGNLCDGTLHLLSLSRRSHGDQG